MLTEDLLDKGLKEDKADILTFEELLEEHQHDHDHELATGRFNFLPFFLITGAQLAAAIGLFYWLRPDQFKSELAQPGLLLTWTFAFGIPLSLFEFLYHRYLLHSSVLPFLGIMHQCHDDHHGLTNVKAPVSKKEPEKMVEVQSDYPIEHEHQEESMQFPPFAISVFFLIFVGLIAVPIKWAFPSQPVIISMLICSTFAYAAYEIWHALLHLPYERYWKPAMEHRLWGGIVRHIYGFHLMHHWRPITNQAVVGFWGWAVWDYLFRTHHRPMRMPLNKAQVNYSDAAIPKPRWPVSALDKLQPKLYKSSRKIEQSFFKLFKRGS